MIAIDSKRALFAAEADAVAYLLDDDTMKGAMARGLKAKQEFGLWFDGERDRGTDIEAILVAGENLIALLILHLGINAARGDKEALNGAIEAIMMDVAQVALKHGQGTTLYSFKAGNDEKDHDT